MQSNSSVVLQFIEKVLNREKSMLPGSSSGKTWSSKFRFLAKGRVLKG